MSSLKLGTFRSPRNIHHFFAFVMATLASLTVFGQGGTGLESNRFDPSNTSTNISLSENDRRANTGVNGWRSAVAVEPLYHGKKYYWEVIYEEGVSFMVGVSREPFSMSNYLGSDETAYGFYPDGHFHHDGSYTEEATTYVVGDRIMVAYDPDTGSLWYGVNGVWSGDPVSGSDPMVTGIEGRYYPAISVYDATGLVSFATQDLEYPLPEGFVVTRLEDSDDDGLSDLFEQQYFGDLEQTAEGDFDNDGVSNLWESIILTDPTDGVTDSDGDGLGDAWELQYFSNLAQLPDSDPDLDGANNAEEFALNADPTYDQFANRFDTSNTSTNISLSENDRRANTGVNGWRSAVAVEPLYHGKKYYWEILYEEGDSLLVGISLSPFPVGSYTGSDSLSYGLQNTGSFYNSGSSRPTDTIYTPGDRLMVAYDPDSGSLWYGVNGVWSGDPVSGSDPVETGLEGTYYPIVSVYDATGLVSFATQDLEYPLPEGFVVTRLEDSDDDGLSDLFELQYFGDLAQTAEGDFDNDGVSNLWESILLTDPTDGVMDSDGDGLGDAWELQYFNNLTQLADADPDLDGANNAEEFALNADPTYDQFANRFDPSNTSANITLGENDRSAYYNSNRWRSAAAVEPLYQGKKYYWEVEYIEGDSVLAGISQLPIAIGAYTGSDSHSYGVQNTGSFYNAGSNRPTDTIFSPGDRLMVAYDPDSASLWYGVNGVWSGDPSSGTDPVETVLAGTYYPMVSVYDATARVSFANQDILYAIPEGFELSIQEDIDDDGLIDLWERQYFGSLDQTGDMDFDNDGLTNAQEHLLGTDPSDAVVDSDGDAMPDAWEFQNFGDLDQDASTDFDLDGLTDLEEYFAGTSPLPDNVNRLDAGKTGAGMVLTDDNTTAVNANATWRSSIATTPFYHGKKYYWEAEVSQNSGYTMVGIASDEPINSYIGSTVHSYGWHNYDTGSVYHADSWEPYTDYGPGDRLMLAYDPAEGKLWFGVNGVWDGDPAAGTGERFSGISGLQYPAVSAYQEQVSVFFFPSEFLYAVPEGFGYSTQDNADLSVNISADDGFYMYVSTDDAEQGNFIGANANWQVVSQFYVDLQENTTNYLHIFAEDGGAIAGLIGDFTLNDVNFEFSNQSQFITTNPEHWQVSLTGFGENYSTPMSRGVNGVGPWGSYTASIDASAQWIWEPGGCINCSAYFSIAINPVQNQPGDSYTYAVGDGNVEIVDDGIDDASVSIIDTLTFGEGIDNTNIRYQRVLDDLQFTLINTDETLTIKNWFTQTPRYQIELIQLADGSELPLSLEALLYVHPELPGFSDFEFFNNNVYVTYRDAINVSRPKYVSDSLTADFEIDTELPETPLSYAIQKHNGWLYYHGQTTIFRYNGQDVEQVSVTSGYPGGEYNFIDNYLFTGSTNGSGQGNRWHGVPLDGVMSSQYFWNDRSLYKGSQTIYWGRGQSAVRFNGYFFFAGDVYGPNDSSAGEMPAVYRSENIDLSTPPTDSIHVDMGIEGIATTDNPSAHGQTNEQSLIYVVANTEYYSYTQNGETWSAAALPEGFVFVYDAGVRLDAYGNYYALVKNLSNDSHFIYRLTEATQRFVPVVTLPLLDALNDNNATALLWKEMRIEGNTITVGALVEATTDYAAFFQSDIVAAGGTDTIPPGVVDVTAVPATNGTNVVLDWSAYDELTNGGDIQHYLVYQSESNFSSASEASLVATVSAGTRSYDVTGLIRDNTYYYAVVAVDVSNNQLTDLVTTSVTMIDSEAPERVEDLSVQSATLTSVVIDWTPSLDTAGDLVGFRITADDETYETTATSFEVTGLSPSSEYDIVVEAFDNDGNLSEGVTVSAMTLLPNPVIASVTTYDSTVEITWPSLGDFNLVAGYEIYLMETDTTDVSGIDASFVLGADQTSARISGLMNDTNYYIAVVVINAQGNRNSSVTTASAMPLLLNGPITVSEPVVTSHSASPTIYNLIDNTLTIEGTRGDNTSIWVDDQQIVPLGSGPWSAEITLPEGESTLSVYARDAGEYAELIARSQPVAYWKLDEVSGSSVFDSSGNGFHGSATSLNFGVSSLIQSGSAINFDPTAATASMGNHQALALSGDMTIELWIDTGEATVGGREMLASYGRIDLPNDGEKNYQWAIGTHSDRIFWMQQFGDGNLEIHEGNFQFEPDRTYHYAAVRDSQTNTVSFYVDGIMVETFAYNFTPDGGELGQLYLGVARGPGNIFYPYRGVMDEVALYDRALTEAELEQHYIEGTMALSSAATEFIFIVDSTAPVIESVSPSDESETNVIPSVIELAVIETGAGIDLTNSDLAVLLNSASVDGNWTIENGILRFTPISPFTEGDYTIELTLRDAGGLASQPFSSSFGLDVTPPSAPQINAVPSTTNISPLPLNGQKDAGTNVSLNGEEIIPSSLDTNWNYEVTLAQGDNALTFTSQDTAGNISSPTVISIAYDNTPPGPVSLVISGEGDGQTLTLDWTRYSEIANGNDIASYAVYLSTSDFGDISAMSALATLPAGTQTFVADQLQRNTTYFVAVVANDIQGNANTLVTTTSANIIDTQAPEEVSGVTVTSTANSVSVSWIASANSDNDLASYRISLNDNTATITADETSYTVDSLAAATAYPITISAVDNDGNASAGVSATAVTWLSNPTIASTEAFNGMVELVWTATTPAELLGQYAIFVSENDFADVNGMAPMLTVSNDQTRARVAGLSNGTTYYFAVVSANTAASYDPVVTTATETPALDSLGPVISAIQFNGVELGSGATISGDGIITASVSDPIGVGRVAFQIDGQLLANDFDGSNGYSAQWNVTNSADGPYTLSVLAYDTLDNESQRSVDVNVALAAPSSPEITSPASGFSTNESFIIVTGRTALGTAVTLYNGDTEVAGPITPDSALNFSAIVALSEGENPLTAVATNRGGDSPASIPVTVTLDTTLPATPGALSATAIEGGEVRLSWGVEDTSQVVGYNLYRSETDFTDPADATLLNATALTTTAYTDIPFTDGTYYYAVQSLNSLGSASALSARASTVVDSTPPRATQILYTHLGNVDEAGGRFGTGTVQVRVTVNEELLTEPFLTIAPASGFPIAVDLTRAAANDDSIQYAGEFAISASTQSGTALAVFSARDLYGNRGTDIDQGREIVIDAQGPSLVGLSVTPTHPIQNDSANPVELSLGLSLSEVAADVPSLFYQLSGAGREEAEITGLVQGDSALEWNVSLSMPSDAGLLEPELLQFRFTAQDDLNNVGTEIEGRSQFQVYQGDLPPLDFPLGLQAEALPGGEVALSWFAVDEADDYQIYRQGPSDSELLPVARSNGELSLTDATLEDGEHLYAVAAIRQDNSQESSSAPGPTVSVTAISALPEAPTNLTLSLLGSGIAAEWTAPAGEDIHYRLYRSDQTQILTVEGLTPIIDNIYSLQALDTSPSPNEHAYAVTTVDAAGNESAPSESVYLNFELLPVNPLTIIQQDDEAPLVSWGHASASVVGYDIFLGNRDSGLQLNSERLTAESYQDVAYSSDQRQYTVVPYDTGDVAGPERSIVLPQLSLALTEDTTINRGVMNRLSYNVTNHGSEPIAQALLRVQVESYDHVSAPFTLDAGATQTVAVIIGGHEDLPAVAAVQTTVEISANSSEQVHIVRNTDVDVMDAALVLGLSTREFTRGGTGQVQFTLENTADVDIEVVTAINAGSNPSNEIRFDLLDEDNNTLASQYYQRVTSLADSEVTIITLPNRSTVARIPAGASFVSDWIDMNVPAAAPNTMSLAMSIDTIHYQLGTAEQVAIAGVSTRRDVSVADTSYSAEILSITPAISYGDQDIVISGRAIDRESSEPLSFVPVTLALTVNGFERVFDVFTSDTGEFSYTFTPLAGEAGVYRVSAVHPDILDRPESGQFTISRVSVSPATFNVRIPYNLARSIPLTLAAGDGTTATNSQLVYEADLQASGTLPEGITIQLPSPVTLAAGEQTSVALVITADETADSSGSLVLALRSDEGASDNLALINVDYAFSDAEPALFVSPSFIETGLAQGSTIFETATIENRGLSPLQNVQVDLLTNTGQAAPAWVYLGSSGALGDLAVGASRTVGVNFNPASDLADGIYNFVLRVTSDNAPTYVMPLYASVTQSGVGNTLFRLSDIYTATQDEFGDIIRGLEGAQIHLQNEQVYTVEETLYTDNFGEALFENLPAGTYRYRASAANHEDKVGRIRIKPGITEAQEVFLDYNLVTVEWSVREITIEDRYEIVLNATFETDVPAAVVVASPLSITLPTMVPGDVFYGEIVLTNHGLVRADDFEFSMPESDQYFSYEVMRGIPDSIEAKGRVSIPFRMVALNSLDPEFDGSGGSGCYSYASRANYTYAYECANGTNSNGAGGTGFYASGDSASCGTAASPPVPTFGGGSNNNSNNSSGGGASVQQAPTVSGMPNCRPETEDMCSTGNGE